MTEAARAPAPDVSGPVVERLVEAGAVDDVVALAIGARGTPLSSRPLGAPLRRWPPPCASRS